MAEKPNPRDNWSSGDQYEPYVGRWSRLVAPEFLAWLDVPPERVWLDVGCGTGVLTQTILSNAKPTAIQGIDQSAGFTDYARTHIQDVRVHFEVGNAQNLPVESSVFDVVVSALVLNFIPDIPLALSEMKRAAKPNGIVAAYVWDYADKMEMMRYFWDTAVGQDARMAHLDEQRRFPMCNPELLRALFKRVGLESVEVRPIDVPTHFRDFDDYWSPFLGGQGSAPSYLATLDEQKRSALRDQIRSSLPVAPDGSISLIARAWAVRGRVSD